MYPEERAHLVNIEALCGRPMVWILEFKVIIVERAE